MIFDRKREKFYMVIRMKIMMRTLIIYLMKRMTTLRIQSNMRWRSQKIRITMELIDKQEKRRH